MLIRKINGVNTWEAQSDGDKKAIEIAKKFAEEYGFNVFLGSVIYNGKIEDGGKTVNVKTLYRHNGTTEDVNIEISVTQWGTGKYKTGERIERVKMPINASERVKANRINKIVEAYKGGRA